jgi:hypothetical protein
MGLHLVYLNLEVFRVLNSFLLLCVQDQGAWALMHSSLALYHYTAAQFIF